MSSSLPLWLTLTLATAVAADSAVLTDWGAAPAPAPAKAPSVPLPPSQGGATRAKAVGFLLGAQHGDGGWGSGDHGSNGQGAASDVATTAFTVLALQRDAAGSGRHLTAMKRGALFVVEAVEQAPAGPQLRTPEGTQIQRKLGPLVDTHLAGLMLGEVVGTFDQATDLRVRRALDIVTSKIASAQRADGSFDGNAWAPVLSTALASQGLARAVQVGAKVDKDVLDKSDTYQNNVGKGDTSQSAGINLYAVASGFANAAKMATRTGSAAPTASAQAEAIEVSADAVQAIRSDDGSFVAGFGSLGGEEMLSYMMISDGMAAKGGAEWDAWNRKISGILGSAQDAQGSWQGHHCITSQVFSTAGGVMTLAAGDMANWRRLHPTG